MDTIEKIKKHFAEYGGVYVLAVGSLAIGGLMVYLCTRKADPEIAAVFHDQSAIEDAILLVNANGYTVIRTAQE